MNEFFLKNRVVLLCIALLLPCLGSASAWEDGDIIFHESRSRQARVIKLVTKSRYTHMGLIVNLKSGAFVLEAHNGVELTPLDDFVSRGVDAHYVVKRLKSDFRPNQEQWAAIRRGGEAWLGRHYDLLFAWGDEEIYCSELVWKLYQRHADLRIGEPVTFRDLELEDRATQILIAERTDSLDLTETIITPQAMFESELLTTIYPKRKLYDYWRELRT